MSSDRSDPESEPEACPDCVRLVTAVKVVASTLTDSTLDLDACRGLVEALRHLGNAFAAHVTADHSDGDEVRSYGLNPVPVVTT